MSIKDLEKNLRPREKALQCGLAALSDHELLALVLKVGNKKESCLALAQRMIQTCGGLANLSSLSIEQLKKFSGIGNAKAIELLACIELVKRIHFDKIVDRDVILNDQDFLEWLQKTLGHQTQEVFLLVFLDRYNHVQGYHSLYQGTACSIEINVNEVFRCAMNHNASKIILAHNHPSQLAMPSLADDQTTRQLVEAGKLLNIKVIDHIIVGYNSFYSYSREQKI